MITSMRQPQDSSPLRDPGILFQIRPMIDSADNCGVSSANLNYDQKRGHRLPGNYDGLHGRTSLVIKEAVF